MSKRYRSVLLLGQDHSELGGIGIEEVTPRISIAISRGRFPKPYAYVDPNEDAVFALTDGTTTVLAVADGHNGFDAARIAIHAVELVAPDVLAAPAQKATALLAEAAVTSVNDSLPPTRVDSRTALTVVVISNGALAAATFGDTVCFVVTRRDIERVGRTAAFIGQDTITPNFEIETCAVEAQATTILASDGLTNYATESAIRSAIGDRGGNAETFVRMAFEGGAGDNVAVAVLGP